MSEDDKKEGLFKRLKDIESKIKSENKKESEPIKNEEQSKIVKDESTVADKKSKEMVLLKDKLDFIFKNFDQIFNSTGKNFLKRFAKDEKKIDYKNLFLEIDDKSVDKDVHVLEEIGTLYNSLIYLLDNSMRVIISAEDQIKFFKAITVSKKIILSIKTDIIDQSEEEKKKIFAKQENVLSNAEMLLKKREELINQFWNKNIISKDEKFYDAPKKSEKDILEQSEPKSDQLIPKWVQVPKDRFDFTKLKINKNKELSTTIDKKIIH